MVLHTNLRNRFFLSKVASASRSGALLRHDGNDGESDGSSEENSSDGNDDDSPSVQQVGNGDGSLLASVGEVVVAGGNVVELSGSVHLDQTSVEIGSDVVHLHAIVDVLLSIVLVIVVIGQQALIRAALLGIVVRLVDESESEHELVRIEEVVEIGLVIDWVVVSTAADLNQVGSIGSIQSFSGLVLSVGVASSPLEVDVVSDEDLKIVGSEVVFDSGISFDDVSSLSANVQVENASRCNLVGSLADFENVRSVLEGSSVFVGVKSELNGEVLSTDSDEGILGDGRKGLSVQGAVNSPVVESSSEFLGSIVEIGGGDVVAETKNTVLACIIWNGPLVGSSLRNYDSIGSDGVAQVVIASNRSRKANGGVNVPGLGKKPLSTSGDAFSIVVELGFSAVVLAKNVLRFGLVESAS